jgi:hypothetical protein
MARAIAIRGIGGCGFPSQFTGDLDFLGCRFWSSQDLILRLSGTPQQFPEFDFPFLFPQLVHLVPIPFFFSEIPASNALISWW